MDDERIRRAAFVTLRRVICERFPRDQSVARGSVRLRVTVSRVTLARRSTLAGSNAVTDIGSLDPYMAAIEGPAPCDGCRNADRCAAQLEACPAFAVYVAHAGELRWRGAPRIPSRERFDAIFAEAPPAKAQTPKRPRLLTAEERRQRNTLRKQRWRQDQQKRQQARDAA
jgi:hypothetical protein